MTLNFNRKGNAKIEDKVAVIAGSSGIGLATAKKFVAEGYVFITGRTQLALDKAKMEIGFNVITV